MTEPNPTTLTRMLLALSCLLCLHLLTGISACETTDADGDGYSSSDDCDDTDASTYPGAPELCDGKDNNCDGMADAPTVWYKDSDKDGYGSSTTPKYTCDGSQPSGYVANASDCDDSSVATYPGAPELCDNKDNSCDGAVEPNQLWYRDWDQDGYGTSIYTDVTCDGSQPSGYVANASDCNDSLASVYPGAPELCDGNDNNCDGAKESYTLWYPDADHDGYGTNPVLHVCDGSQPGGHSRTSGDCDDANDTVYPGAPELCDALDNDCDGDTTGEVIWYADDDGDGFGDPSTAEGSCADIALGFTGTGGDCDDLDAARNPGFPDVCDGVDNDCDSAIDEDAPAWYLDSDQDGFGTGRVLLSCTQPAGYALADRDCNDADGTLHPGAREECDGLDNDCSGTYDAELVPPWYADRDGDGWGDGSAPSTTCPRATGTVPVPGDCQDSDTTLHPVAVELCDGLDNDCSGTADDVPYYADLDGDGFGNEAAPASCTTGASVSPARGDCNDQTASVHPGANDSSGDGVDSDCGGRDAADIHVGLTPASRTSLAAALTAAPTGTILWVGPGLYLEHDLSFAGKTLQLRSTHGAAATRVDARWQGRHLSFVSGESPASLLDGFTFTNGRVQGAGGSVRISDSSPTLLHLVFADNAAEGPLGQGGALALTRSSSSLTDQLLTRNRAGLCGTYTYANSSTDYGYTTRTNQDWRGCSPGLGGALFLDSSTVTLKALSASDNSAQGAGGAILVRKGSVQLQDSTILDNRAEAVCVQYSNYSYSSKANSYEQLHQTLRCAAGGEGGGLAGDQVALTLTNNRFESNTAPSWCGVEGNYTNESCGGGCGDTNTSQRTECTLGRGGAISIFGGSLDASNETWLDNAAALGGALAIQEATLDLNSSQSSRNRALASTASVQLEATSFDSYGETGESLLLSSAVGGAGGALHLHTTTARLDHLELGNNAAAQKGGAIAAKNSSLEATQLLLRSNEALGTETTADELVSSFSYARAGTVDGFGGSLALEGGSLLLTHARVEDSQARTGGGLHLRGDATISHVLLADNVATGSSTTLQQDNYPDPDTYTYEVQGGQGAGLYLSQSALTLTQAVLALNDAQDVTAVDGQTTRPGTGGGLWMLGATGKVVSITNTIVSHNLGVGLYSAGGTPTLTWSLLSAPTGETVHNLSSLDPTVLTADPGFLSSNARGEPTDFHLSKSSVCINSGATTLLDKDGTRSDLGLYGGALGASFDLDEDLKPDWFWPGTLSQPPAGFSSSSYDRDDLDASR